MERLKTRQRLSKLITEDSPFVFIEPTQEPEDELNNSRLASKIRVNSLISQSIPDMKYPPKVNSHVTAKQIEEFQRKENTPIEINGNFYRLHPASIPEPEFDENDQTIDLDGISHEMSNVGNIISQKLKLLTKLEEDFFEVNREIKQLDINYNREINLLDENLLPPEDFSLEGDISNLQNALRVIERNKARKYRQSNADELKKEALNAEYAERKQLLVEQRELLLSALRKTTQEIDNLREEKELFTDNFSQTKAENDKRKKRVKQKINAYEENLKTLNRNFNLTQEPNETAEEYIERIRTQTEAIEDPNLVVDRFNLQEARDFKQNMKEIIRDNSVIEVAYNTLFQENDALIPEINKIFQLIKTQYQKKYGSYQLKDVDLINFLKKMIETPEKIEEEIDIPQGLGAEDFTDKYKALSKGKRYTKPELIFEIGEIKDFFENDFAVDVGGFPAIIHKGLRGGLTVTYKNDRKSISLTDKSVLIAIYVAILERIKRANPAEYQKLNTTLNRRTAGEYGEGLKHEKMGKSVKLGAIHIDLNKLYYKNILSITQNGVKINGVKNVPVSEEMVKILIDLTKGKYPTSKELNKLELHENQIFDALLHIAKLHKRVENTTNKSVENLKNRLTLIEGELSAGNTNKELYSELRDIVFKLHHLGEITQSSATNFLKQFK